MKKSISEKILGRQVAEIGQIKIGGQSVRKGKGKGKPPPVKYDHFVVVTRERADGTGNLIRDEHLHSEEVLGAEPKELDVRLMYPTLEENFLSRMNTYDGENLVRVCDGEERQDRDTGEEGKCLRGHPGCECKPYGRLKVILEAAPTFGGLYGYRTSSWETVRNIQSALEFFFDAFGTLRGIPLKMVMYPATDQVEGKTFKNWKVGLVLRSTFESASKMALEYHRADQITRRELKALASGSEKSFDVHDQEDEAELGAEFYPPEPEDESQEEEPDQAPGEDVGKLRAEYHAVLRELIQDDRAKTDTRRAFHQVHPELPDSEKEFTAGHYARAIMEVRRWGTEILDKAVATMAEKDPATDTDIEELKAAIDASGLDAEQAGLMWWVIATGVRTWVLRETQRLKLNAAQASEPAPTPEAQGSFV